MHNTRVYVDLLRRDLINILLQAMRRVIVAAIARRAVSINIMHFRRTVKSPRVLMSLLVGEEQVLRLTRFIH